MIKKGKLL